MAGRFLRPAPRPAAAGIAEHARRTLALAGPVIVARCGMLVMFTVDTVMTGQAGGDELAWLGIAFAPQITLMVIGIGLLSGTVVLVSQADGAGRRAECGQVLRIGLLNGLLLGLLWAAVLFEGEALLAFFGQGPALAAGGGRVMAMFAWGMPAIFLFVAASMFLEGIGRPLPGMAVALAANFVNAGLNWALIYGHAGSEAMGAGGAALATSIVRWLMFLALAAYVLAMADRRTYGVLRRIAAIGALQWRFLRLGVPMMLSYALETGAFMAIAMMAGHLGADAVAAYQATMNVNAFCFMVAIGMATATAVRVGNAIGRRDRRAMAAAGWVGTGLVFLAMLPLALLVAAFPESLASFYSVDGDVVALIAAALFVGAFLIPGDGLQAVLLGALRGAADIWPAACLGFVAFWVVMVPAAWLLGSHLQGGVPGLIWGEVAGISAAALLFAWRFRRIAQRDIAPFS